MNKKTLLFLVIAMVLVCTLAVTAFAADNTVYVADGGDGDGSSASSPIGTLSAAITTLNGNGGTIVLCGDTTVSEKITVSEQTGNLTFTAENGAKMIIKNRFQFAKNTNDNFVTINVPFDIAGNYYCLMFGGYNNIVFAENFDVTLSGGDSAALYFFGGMHAGEAASNIDCIAELPYSIEVNGGTFARFEGGNYRGGISDYIGSLSELVTITINGGTFGQEGTYAVDSNNKTYDTFSVSGMSILAGGAKLTINDGTFNMPVYAQGRIGAVTNAASEKSSTTASDKKYYAIDGDITVDITRGTFNGGSLGAYYTQVAYTQLVRGNFTVNISGGTFASGTVVDATQVKGYDGTNTKATITVNDSISISAKRFDTVTGAKVQTVVCDPEPIRIVYIGDSITEGYTQSGVDRITETHPARLLAYAEADGKDVVVSNFGVSSSGVLPSTSKYYFDMLAWPIVSEETDPNYVMIMIGTNDANASGGTNGAMTLFEEKYSYLIETMGNLHDTDKVFITNTIYRNIDTLADLRASAVTHPIQERVAKAFAAKDSDKYVFVDLYGLTLDAASDDSLFKADDGKVYERLHPARYGLDLIGKTMYNVAFKDGITEPEESYKRTDIYISADGTTFGDGTADAAVSSFPVAFDKIALGSEVTIHIKGTVTFSTNMFIPLGAKKVTIVGEGTDAVLSIGGNTLKLGTDTKFDNLTLKTTNSGGAYIVGCYNDVEITDTVTLDGKWSFYAGHNVYGDIDPSTATAYDTAKSASSDNDCTININSGAYTNFILGNVRFDTKAPFGTYSGKMTATVGEGVTVGNNSPLFYGISGHNYLTGTIDATLNGWGSVDINEFAQQNTIADTVTYEPRNNTGVVNITRASGMTNDIVAACDFSGDGNVDIKDALMAIRYCLDGFDSDKSANYYGDSVDSILDVIFILKKAIA